MLGFISRNTKSFKHQSSSLIILFKSLVLPNLLYASIIWTPHQQYMIQKLEGVQHRFLRMLSFRFYIPMSKFDHDFQFVSKFFNLHSIKSIHDMNDLVFMFKFLKSKDKHPTLDKLFSFRTHCYNVRSARQLLEHHCKFMSTYFIPRFRLRRSFNSAYVKLSAF